MHFSIISCFVLLGLDLGQAQIVQAAKHKQASAVCSRSSLCSYEKNVSMWKTLLLELNDMDVHVRQIDQKY